MPGEGGEIALRPFLRTTLLLVKSQTDKHTESNAYEPTVQTHKWAPKSLF